MIEHLPGGLDLLDETYVCPVFEEDITPILVTDASVEASDHQSTFAATGPVKKATSQLSEAWTHPRGSRIVAWTRTPGRSRVVYIQPGDSVSTLRSPAYQALVRDSLSWTVAEDRSPNGHKTIIASKPRS